MSLTVFDASYGEVRCMLKRGQTIAAQACVQKQADEDCFCPFAFHALASFKTAMTGRAHGSPEEREEIEAKRATLAALLHRAEGFRSMPEDAQLEGPARAVFEEVRKRMGPRSASTTPAQLREQIKDSLQPASDKAQRNPLPAPDSEPTPAVAPTRSGQFCRGSKATPKCGKQLRSSSTGDQCRACRMSDLIRPCGFNGCQKMIRAESPDDICGLHPEKAPMTTKAPPVVAAATDRERAVEQARALAVERDRLLEAKQKLESELEAARTALGASRARVADLEQRLDGRDPAQLSDEELVAFVSEAKRRHDEAQKRIALYRAVLVPAQLAA